MSRLLVFTMATLPAGTSLVLGEGASPPHQGLGGDNGRAPNVLSTAGKRPFSH